MNKSTSDSTSTVRLSSIYGLCDELGTIRYVGVTSKPLQDRLKAHVREGRKCVLTRKARWIYSMKEDPTIVLLEETTDRTREIYWIAHYRALGNNLTNLTDGGEGHLGHSPSEQVRAKISKAHQGKKGHPTSEEARAKISKASRELWQQPEYKSKMSRALKGKHKSDETRAKMSAAWMGRKKSQEHCESLRKAWQTRRENPSFAETQAKTIATRKARNASRPNPQKGVPRSEETRAKIKASWIIRRQKMGITNACDFGKTAQGQLYFDWSENPSTSGNAQDAP